MNILCFILLSLFGLPHPVHISSTNIEYNEEKKVFKISIKIFTDDFECALGHKYNVPFNLGKSNENEEANTYINHYILEHFSFIVNGKNQTRSRLKFTGKKFNHEAVWLNFEFKYVGSIKTIKIVNSVIHDLYLDQKNLLIFSYKGTLESHKLTYSDNSVEIDISGK